MEIGLSQASSALGLAQIYKDTVQAGVGHTTLTSRELSIIKMTRIHSDLGPRKPEAIASRQAGGLIYWTETSTA